MEKDLFQVNGMKMIMKTEIEILKSLGHKKCQHGGCLEYFKPTRKFQKFCGNALDRTGCAWKRRLIQSKKYQREHKELYAQWHKKWVKTEHGRKKSLQIQQKYYFNNIESRKEYNSKHFKENRTYYNSYMRKYNKENREIINKKQQKYYHKNREIILKKLKDKYHAKLA